MSTKNKKKIFRDVLISSVLLTVALVFMFLQMNGSWLTKKTAITKKKAPATIPTSPVLENFKKPGWALSQTRVSMTSLQLTAKPSKNKESVQNKKTADEKTKKEMELILQQREENDQKWMKLAKDKAADLYNYASLVPPEDTEVFKYIVDNFVNASEKGIYRQGPVEHEGDFFNRLFFAAGRWGGEPAFPRGWVYLLRANGCKLEPAVEHSVTKLIKDLFTQGLKETKAIETDIFGEPLEGGNPRHWDKVGLPPMSESKIAWNNRNELCLSLYYDLLSGLEERLSKENFEKVCKFFDLFNLKT